MVWINQIIRLGAPVFFLGLHQSNLQVSDDGVLTV